MTNDASLPRGWMYHLYFGNSSPFLDSSKENQASLFTVAAPEGMPDPTEGTRHLTLLSWKIRLGGELLPKEAQLGVNTMVQLVNDG